MARSLVSVSCVLIDDLPILLKNNGIVLKSHYSFFVMLEKESYES